MSQLGSDLRMKQMYSGLSGLVTGWIMVLFSMLRKKGRLETEEKAMPVQEALILQFSSIPLGGQNVSIAQFWS